MDNIKNIIAGIRPDVIGTTKLSEFPNSIVGFRISYPSGGSGEDSSTFTTYPEAKKWFDDNKVDYGDLHFYATLLADSDDDAEAIDEELIDSFWDEEEN